MQYTILLACIFRKFVREKCIENLGLEQLLRNMAFQLTEKRDKNSSFLISELKECVFGICLHAVDMPLQYSSNDIKAFFNKISLYLLFGFSPEHPDIIYQNSSANRFLVTKCRK
ncbi:hypothetical protein Zmor_021792 [Zophobas morio]|uniref:Uncharacterized protein n=1 Tax=Zophobas morio TaxID=2755281 RepID=A0AA38I9S8_9CUCU|nr:hypothetical protein Zmor_021792 [Zophobas morio]